MIKLTAKIRDGKKRTENSFSAVLYGPKIKNLLIQVDAKEFHKILGEAGESSLIDLEIDGPSASSGQRKTFKVLIHEIQREPVSGKIIHADFYQPLLDQEIEAKVPLIFEGEAPAVKNLSGTLVKNIHELEIKALPQDLPHQITVNVEGLETFENEIKISDLLLPVGVRAMKDRDEVVVKVIPVQKVEEELEKPIEEKVEEVEKAEEKKTKEGETEVAAAEGTEEAK